MTPVQLIAIVAGIVFIGGFAAYIIRKNQQDSALTQQREDAIAAAERWFRATTGFTGTFIEKYGHRNSREQRWYVSLESPELVGREDVEIAVREDGSVDTGHWQASQIAERWFRERRGMSLDEPIETAGEIDMTSGLWTISVMNIKDMRNIDLRIGRDGSVQMINDDESDG